MNQTRREELKQVFENRDTYASTMLIVLADLYDDLDFLGWDPMALRDDVGAKLGARIPQENMDKLMALILAMTSDLFYHDVDAFIHICNALAGEGSDFRMFDPAEIDEVAWAVTEVLLNDPPEDKTAPPFDDGVIEYIKQQATVEGFIRMPSVLQFVPPPEAAEQNLADVAAMGEEMFGAAWDAGQDKAKEVEAEVSSRMEQLFQQIQQLPLNRADSESWQAFAGKPLRARGLGTPRAEAGRTAAAEARR